MRQRELSGQTVAEVADELREREYEIWGGAVHDIELFIEEDDPYLTLGNNEVPITSSGLDELATFAGVPRKFIERIDRDEQQWILTNRLQRLEKPEATIYWNDLGVQEVRPGSEVRVAVADLVDEVVTRLPLGALVDTWWANSVDFRMDVIVGEDSPTGIGGDTVEVGDITRGGVRIGQDRQRNLAPWVQPYLYRLACTNGMEVPDHGLKVEARKCSAEQIVSLFGHEVTRAFSRVEGDIGAFYDLKNQRFDDAERALLKVAREAKLPDRTVRELVGSFPAGEDQTMFDIVNHITSFANSLNPHSSSYRALQVVGGTRVYDHSQRCERCLSRI